MSANAFVDRGFPLGSEFCLRFLSSPEFNITTLRRLVPSAASQQKKEDIASSITNALERGQLAPDEILLEYVKQSRTWLSIKQGPCAKTPNIKPPDTILREFGEEGWYGPIRDRASSRKWYIRVHNVPYHEYVGIGEARTVEKHRIRWTTIAEVDLDYVALSWNGFTFTQLTDYQIDTPAQFPFWNYIPGFFNELGDCCQSQWEYPNFHRLVLHNMWDKYLNTHLNGFRYIWQHLRVRAEAAGIALNAHSSGIAEIDVKGLHGLSRHLAKSVFEALKLPDDPVQISQAESALLRTLIKERGTKSYEFSLTREPALKEAECEGLEPKVQPEELFKAHCYFGLKPNSKTQDSLQHFKCYSGYAKGSTTVLNFLLTELRIRG